MPNFYRTGRIEPKNLAHLKQLSRERHYLTLQALPTATEPTWDSRQQGWIGKVKDQSSCGSCFPAGTSVRLANGAEKPIELVSTNDSVLTAEGNVHRVSQTMRRYHDGEVCLLFTANAWFLMADALWSIKATPEHPIYTKRGYVPISELTKDDWVGFPRQGETEYKYPIKDDNVTQDDTHIWRRVSHIERQLFTGDVYNLEVEEDHSYVAEGVGVHNCWDFSGTCVVEIAFNKAQLGGGPNSMILSEEYTLDCGQNGGCNGDDNTTVLDWAKTKGLPLTSDYGPYQGQEGTCKYSSTMKLWKIDDWGFADPNNQNGVSDTQLIKNAIKAYGCVGAAIAADNSFMNVQPGEVFDGNSQSINHDIILVGWDDSKGAWLLRNSWGESWCDGGYCWIKYGANEVGTEAVWAVVNNPNPPIPPDPSSSSSDVPVPPSPFDPSILEHDLDQLFKDLEVKFADQFIVVLILEVVRFACDAYINTLKQKMLLGTFTTNELQDDVNKIFKDIEARFTDSPYVVMILELVRMVISSYMITLGQR